METSNTSGHRGSSTDGDRERSEGPDSILLFSVMERILRGWRGVHVRDLGDPVEGPADLPLELGIRLTGASSGFLVLRTFRGFAEGILRHSTDPHLRDEDPANAFRSLAVLYCVSILIECWKPQFLHFGPLLPRPTSPRDWPSRAPDAARAMLVDKSALEIRYWRDAR